MPGFPASQLSTLSRLLTLLAFTAAADFDVDSAVVVHFTLNWATKHISIFQRRIFVRCTCYKRFCCCSFILVISTFNLYMPDCCFCNINLFNTHISNPIAFILMSASVTKPVIVAQHLLLLLTHIIVLVAISKNTYILGMFNI